MPEKIALSKQPKSEIKKGDLLLVLDVGDGFCSFAQVERICDCRLPGFDVGKPEICPTCHKKHRGVSQ